MNEERKAKLKLTQEATLETIVAILNEMDLTVKDSDGANRILKFPGIIIEWEVPDNG